MKKEVAKFLDLLSRLYQSLQGYNSTQDKQYSDEAQVALPEEGADDLLLPSVNVHTHGQDDMPALDLKARAGRLPGLLSELVARRFLRVLRHTGWSAALEGEAQAEGGGLDLCACKNRDQIVAMRISCTAAHSLTSLRETRRRWTLRCAARP